MRLHCRGRALKTGCPEPGLLTTDTDGWDLYHNPGSSGVIATMTKGAALTGSSGSTGGRVVS